MAICRRFCIFAIGTDLWRKRLEVLIISKILMLNGNVSRAQTSAVQAVLYLIDTQVIGNGCI